MKLRANVVYNFFFTIFTIFFFLLVSPFSDFPDSLCKYFYLIHIVTSEMIKVSILIANVKT